MEKQDICRQTLNLRSVNELEKRFLDPDRSYVARVIQVVWQRLFKRSSKPPGFSHAGEAHILHERGNRMSVKTAPAESAVHLRLMQANILIGFEALLEKQSHQNREYAPVAILRI